MKTVILNADDFGRSERINRAIIQAHTQGVLTSASLMVNEEQAAGAVELARRNPGLAVGLHLTLSDGLSALPRTEIPALADSTGRFRTSPATAAVAAFFLPGAQRQVSREVAAQFERFAATGLPLSHVDGHQHLHMNPAIWDALVRRCEEYGVRRVRIPYEEFVPPAQGSRFGGRLEWVAFRALRRRCLRTIRGRGFVITERVYGHLNSGRMSSPVLLDLLGRLKGRTNEIYLHPGAAQPGADAELEALLDPRVRDRIRELGLQLGTYPRLGLPS